MSATRLSKLTLARITAAFKHTTMGIAHTLNLAPSLAFQLVTANLSKTATTRPALIIPDTQRILSFSSVSCSSITGKVTFQVTTGNLPVQALAGIAIFLDACSVSHLDTLHVTVRLALHVCTAQLSVKTHALIALTVKLLFVLYNCAINLTILGTFVLRTGHLTKRTRAHITLVHKDLSVVNDSLTILTYRRTLKLGTRNLSELTLAPVAAPRKELIVRDGPITGCIETRVGAFHGGTAHLTIITRTLVTPLLKEGTMGLHFTIDFTFFCALILGTL